MNIGGFSDSVFNVICAFLADNNQRFVAEVEAIELYMLGSNSSKDLRITPVSRLLRFAGVFLRRSSMLERLFRLRNDRTSHSPQSSRRKASYCDGRTIFPVES